MITLVLGGARSGKSAYAESLAATTARRKLYLATSEAMDEEMAARIKQHQRMRAQGGWQTIEEPIAIQPLLTDPAYANHVILVDCLTLWLSNLLHYEKDVVANVAHLTAALQSSQAEIVLVSNEVGLGIVPESSLARRFRDEAGRLHQQVGTIAERLIFMMAGYPMLVKGTV